MLFNYFLRVILIGKWKQVVYQACHIFFVNKLAILIGNICFISLNNYKKIKKLNGIDTPLNTKQNKRTVKKAVVLILLIDITSSLVQYSFRFTLVVVLDLYTEIKKKLTLHISKIKTSLSIHLTIF